MILADIGLEPWGVLVLPIVVSFVLLLRPARRDDEIGCEPVLSSEEGGVDIAPKICC